MPVLPVYYEMLDLQMIYCTRLGAILGRSKKFELKSKTYLQLMKVWQKDALVSQYVGNQKILIEKLLNNVEKLREEFEVWRGIMDGEFIIWFILYITCNFIFIITDDVVVVAVVVSWVFMRIKIFWSWILWRWCWWCWW